MVELLNAPPPVSRPVSLPQDSDQPPQTFKESLLAASRASSDVGRVHDDGARTGRRQNPLSDDRRSPHAMLRSAVVPVPDPPQQPAQQFPLVRPDQQLPVIDPAPVIPTPLPPRGAGDAPKAASLAVAPARDGAVLQFPSTGPSTALPVVTKPDNIPSGEVHEQSDPSPVAPSLPVTEYASQVATSPSAAVTVASTAVPTNTALSDRDGSAPSVLPTTVRVLVPVVASDTSQGDLPSAPSAPSPHQQPHAGAIPSVVPGTPVKTISDTVAKAFPDAVPHMASTGVPSAVRNPASSLSANASSNATAAPSLHDFVAKGDAAEKSNPVSSNEVNPAAPSPAPDGQAAVPSLPVATADQVAALIQPVIPLPVTAPAHAFDVSPAAVGKPSEVAGADRKDGPGSSNIDVTGLKQHAQSASVSAPSQAVSQDNTSSGNQTQDGASQPGQNAATTQVNFANHNVAAVDHAQSSGVAVLTQTAPAPADISGHTAKAAQTAAAPTVVVPPAVPVINTARLIQSMGQSEMRVGMRSNDFGNISISTSATRDLISAQISLDHGELARTLATHLPEMQAKFGGSQAMNVRIDTNGVPAGQSAGTSASMSNGSDGQSRSDRQQSSSGTSRQSGQGFAVELNAIPAGVLPAAESRLDVRLDIRV